MAIGLLMSLSCICIHVFKAQGGFRMSYPLTLGRRAGMEYPPVHALEAFCFSAAPTLDALRHVSEFIPTVMEVTGSNCNSAELDFFFAE